MFVSKVTEEIKQKLRLDEISTTMKSLESAEWIVYETENDKIVGAAGIGGLFHSSSININEKFQGRGYGKKIQKRLVEEAKFKNFSYVTVFVDPRNTSSVKMHQNVGYQDIFRVHYSSEIIQDVKIIVLKKEGEFVKYLLSAFNTKIGMFFLASILKIFQNNFRQLIGYNEKNIPKLSFNYIIKKFEKI